MTRQTLLAILQQAEYDLRYFDNWVLHHAQDTAEIQPEQWTTKLRLIEKISRLFNWLSLEQQIVLAVKIISPFDSLTKTVFCTVAQLKLWWLKQRGLKILAIAGSYGKTSTKQILEQLLKDDIALLVTPKSINTPVGIAQVISSRLTQQHQLFVVELGEYYQGDIASLARFVMPDYGIVTPIGRQHLERMGTATTIAQTIGELRQYFEREPEKCLVADVNGSFWQQKIPGQQEYGQLETAEWRVTNGQVNRNGTECLIHTPHHQFPVFTPLLGLHQAVNILPSLWLAKQLQIPLEKVIARCATVAYIHRRHEPTYAENNVLIIDNSYNTNPDSVISSLRLLDQLTADRKILITVGFVELGDESAGVHEQFGRDLVSHVDYLGIIDSPSADAIQSGFLAAGGKENQITRGKNPEDIMTNMRDKIIANSIILFEGGYRELIS